MFGKKESEEKDVEVFTIFDSKTSSYRLPSYAINRFDLLRQVHNLFKDPQQERNELILNAEDFSIFKIGEYSRKTGVLKYHNAEHIANLHDIKASLKSSQAL